MIISLGVWSMIFNKFSFMILAFLFLSACGLRLAEQAPPVPEYELEVLSETCSNLNYTESFRNYFLENHPLSSAKLTEALKCISFEIKTTKRLIRNEYLNKQDIVRLFDEGVIELGDNLRPNIYDVFNSEYFDDFLFIKNNLIQLIDPNFEKKVYHSNFVCQTPQVERVISNPEADILEGFLKEELSELFSVVEKDASNLFNDFFQKYSVSKSDLKSDEKLIFFVYFLSNYFSETFPSYSQFLKKQIEDIQYYEDTYFFSEEVLHKESILPLLGMLGLPFPSEVITAQNVKYMVLNIYLMQSLFKVYDLNEDFNLSSEELKPLSCMMVPLISYIISDRLRNEPDWVKNIYTYKPLSHYILRTQRIPTDKTDIFGRKVSETDLRLVWDRILVNPDKPYSLSYGEISRLVHTLFVEFFEQKIH